MPSVPYIEVDRNDSFGHIDATGITIEGADLLVGRVAKKSRVTDIRDYLGVGKPEIWR